MFVLDADGHTSQAESIQLKIGQMLMKTSAISTKKLEINKCMCVYLKQRKRAEYAYINIKIRYLGYLLGSSAGEQHVPTRT